MAQLTRTADRDRAWFQDRPGRRHRARYAEPAERQVFEGGRDLALLIRHLGRDVLVYQPVVLSGSLPTDEERIATLFARALQDPLPVPALGPERLGEAVVAVEPGC